MLTIFFPNCNNFVVSVNVPYVCPVFSMCCIILKISPYNTLHVSQNKKILCIMI